MKVKRLSELIPEIKREYDKDPYHWRILRGKDSNQHITTYIAHDDKKLWQLKSIWKNPFTPIGIGSCIKRNLNEEIQQLMTTGTDLPIHEVYPAKENPIIALGLGKYSQSSTDQIREILFQDIPGQVKKVEEESKLELKRLLKKEQLFNHYI